MRSELRGKECHYLDLFGDLPTNGVRELLDNAVTLHPRLGCQQSEGGITGGVSVTGASALLTLREYSPLSYSVLFYKFRSLSNFEFTADILVNERLYCAEYHALNDPFEGQFLVRNIPYETNVPGEEFFMRIHDPVEEAATDEQMKSVFPNGIPRICSLSLGYDDVRMWSYYGDSHRGIAIILDIEPSESLKPVIYKPTLPVIDILEVLQQPDDNLTDILLQKTVQWQYESEWRAFHNEQYLDVKGKIIGIILGCRFPEANRRILRRLAPDIDLFQARLNHKGAALEFEDKPV